MSRFLERALAVVLLGLVPLAGFALEGGFHGIGRAATPAEVKAWDIDVRPDFTGLPPGSGSVERGQQVWEGRCAVCHGTFGESNEVFTPLVGGTTPEDIKTGHAATLATPQPVRTTLSKVATLSTLWDYINRAMPWNAPKSLSSDEVYAVLAYLLNLGDIVPADFTLSDANIRDVQNRLPNRHGMTRDHGLWETRGKPDVHNVACMKDCAGEARVASFLPPEARNNHGNLADQNRPYGAIRGQVTSPVAAASARGAATAGTAGNNLTSTKQSPRDVAQAAGCLTCHGTDRALVGPGFRQVASKYRQDAAAEARLIAKVKTGGVGAWGAVPMPPQSQVQDEQVATLVRWVLSGAN